MDIKAEIEKLTTSVTKNPEMMEKFKKDPIGTAKGLLGNVLPDETVEKIVDAVQAKIAAGKLGDKVQGLLGKFGK